LIVTHGHGDFWLVDFGSSNGTRLNGIGVIEPRRLKNGDVIEINSRKLLFRENRRATKNPTPRNGAEWEETEKNYTAYQSIGQGVLVLNGDGAIQTMSPHAREWLAIYFPRSRTPNKTLPAQLLSWIKKQQARSVAKGSIDRRGTPLVLTRDAKRLRVQLADAGAGEHVLLFNEEELALSQAKLQRLGLTERESEVMFWVAEGKTNAEIASILNASARTIERHVANIFTKFGVENRVAAVRHIADGIITRST